PARRAGVDPYDVEAVLRHLGKISLHDLTSQPLLPVLVYLEGAVADASNPELFFPDVEKFPAHSGAFRDKAPFGSSFLQRLNCLHTLGYLSIPCSSPGSPVLILTGF